MYAVSEKPVTSSVIPYDGLVVHGFIVFTQGPPSLMIRLPISRYSRGGFGGLVKRTA